jgi:ABC-type glycerol-3-phosphate transport system substrate-binding protein
MKHANLTVLLAAMSIAAGLTLSGCSGGSSGYDEPPPAPPPPPPASTQTNFTAFTRSQMGESMTTETAEPMEVETIDWVFTDDDDEAQYDDVISASM